ncbi:DUF1450 domain-containing protein [Orenia marismortui]|uniref:Uncharacterized protein YuzB (UPF0349 family) n=1 Tax=Orenia marismortui TaxID=46469 RepID=A0A4R8GM43_9FIRM|nr:DUF1450 domain-containing protein [Orenia marismortui]TDX46760.1 uncharacterized protein YuzB (UPF0349 family) [Orenia marismortui]
MPVVSFCENNFVHGVEGLITKIEDFEDVSVEIESCLGFCGDCAIGPFALVDGDLLQAETIDELYNRIKEEL